VEQTFPANHNDMSLSVVIPVYKAEQNLPFLINSLTSTLKSLKYNYEVILVNDGSPDRSWPVIRDLAGQYPEVRGINLMRNYGQHNALLCGIRAAINPVIITMDDDGEHPPDQIPLLIAALSEDCDVVYGAPAQLQHGLLRNLASLITKFVLQSSMGADVATKISAFRAFRTELRDAFTVHQGPYINLDVLLTWGTTRFVAVTVRHDQRRVGQSNYTVMKLITHAFNMLTGYSSRPLQVASIIGFTFTLFGIGIFLFVIGRYLIEGGSVPGFPFLASIVAIFSGVQLFALGVIGEYLSRMHFRLMDRPTYIVREQIKTERQDR